LLRSLRHNLYSVHLQLEPDLQISAAQWKRTFFYQQESTGLITSSV
jgi:hypothetical protein